MTGYGVGLLEVTGLRPSEEFDASHAAKIAEDIRSAGVMRQPILVERQHNVILDGHHRWQAAQMLGLKRIPCILIDYGDQRLKLASWTSRSFMPDEVIQAGTTGQLLPKKSTRHLLEPAPQAAPVRLDDLR
jgi:hypothetical protein